jgi:SH3 domain protein
LFIEGSKVLRALSVFLVFFAVAAGAQTLYVDDELVITVRSGPSTRNAILETIRSGAAVEKLGENEKGDYFHVRVVADGTEGWALSQYLTTERAARDRLADAQRELSTARQRVDELQQSVDDLTERLRQTQGALEEAQSKSGTLSSQLEDIRSASANAIALRDQNESLRARVSDMNQTIDRLQMQSTEFASRSRQNWFVVGAGVLFGGIVIGLVAPTLRKRRSSRW